MSGGALSRGCRRSPGSLRLRSGARSHGSLAAAMALASPGGLRCPELPIGRTWHTELALQAALCLRHCLWARVQGRLAAPPVCAREPPSYLLPSECCCPDLPAAPALRPLSPSICLHPVRRPPFTGETEPWQVSL